jgi:uncharacterized repeat protein (TIGR03803 family)
MKAVFVALFAGTVACASVQPVWADDAAAFKEKILYSFCGERNCLDGAYPGDSVIDVNGMLYGTTSGGGRGVACNSQGCGTAFSLDPNTGAEKVLYSFCRQLFCPDGTYPLAALIDVKGTLYGTTFQGGSTSCNGSGCGTLFSLNPSTGAESVLHAFGSGTDGVGPFATLIHVQGMLYGTTQGGGTSGMGTAFALDPKTGAEKVLYSFCRRWPDCSDGFNPSRLIDLNGTLYGTTSQGGAYKCGNGVGCGTVFSLDPKTGAETVLHSFGNGKDGWYPGAGVIAINGMLYGTTSGGGVAGCGGFGCGTVFSIDPGTGVEKVLYSFCSQQNCTDGADPVTTLIDVKGKLYGTADSGGNTGCGGSGCGTVFSIDPGTGTEKVVYSFLGGTDGANPQASLIDSNGTLYGTTGAGGNGYGTVFLLTKR